MPKSWRWPKRPAAPHAACPRLFLSGPSVHHQPGGRRPVRGWRALGTRRRWRRPRRREELAPRPVPHRRAESPSGHRHGARMVGLATARADRPCFARRLPGQPRRGPGPSRNPQHRQRTGGAAPAKKRRARTAPRRDLGQQLTSLLGPGRAFMPYAGQTGPGHHLRCCRVGRARRGRGAAPGRAWPWLRGGAWHGCSRSSPGPDRGTRVG